MELNEINEEKAETKIIGGGDRVSGEKGKFPKHVFFIIGNEFCERFSYYGMRTVLVLYVRNFLLFDDDTSTSIFHAFTMLAYFFPLVGGIIADSYWGKYKTIAYLSIVYVIGHVLKTIAAIPFIPGNTTHTILSMFGLLLIAVGTGGIKPCVSSFGGDQFKPHQVLYLSQYFAMFYFSINAGALISKFITPMFRADLDCYPGHHGPKYDECFTVAFGVPGLLMLVAVGFFFAGTKYYTQVPLEGSIFWKFCKCVYSALRNKWRRRKNEEGEEHWVDYADAPESLKRDTKYVMGILLLFTPLPFFWALFDQQGSRWTLQALQLDGTWGSFYMKPDQMDVINPLLIITLIPLFETTLYPLLRYYNVNFSPLKKMTAGLILAGVSFLFAAGLQFAIDADLTPLPPSDQFSVRVINLSPCDVTMTSSNPDYNGIMVGTEKISDTQFKFVETKEPFTLSHVTCVGNEVQTNFNVTSGEGKVIDYVISGLLGEHSMLSEMATAKPENGRSSVTFLNPYDVTNIVVNASGYEVTVPAKGRSKPVQVKSGTSSYRIYAGTSEYEGRLEVGVGGVYTVVLVVGDDVRAMNTSSGVLKDVNTNNINIAWMIPQYFVITVGEVFLSITGLEFSYTQAPASMKSVVSSIWLLTVSMGSIIVLVVAESRMIDRQAHEFIFFACLIGVASIVFAFLARRYKASKPQEIPSKKEKNEIEKTELLEEKTDFSE
nr:solute carrier family 15 member 2 isoform X1 [Ciona intestinalis]|eukprot:XP_018670730.1 solute carrier family 15 member 2 isoform X1 [Ciona intestinalis]